MAKQLNVNLAFTADTSQAKAQIQELQNALNNIHKAPAREDAIFNGKNIREASQAALELSQHLQKAVNVDTGKLDLARFSSSLKASGKTLDSYYETLLRIGPEGQQAFLGLATAIAQAEAPVVRVNARLSEMWTTMKNTARWQLSSSVLHGFMGTLQSAYGYAQDLNESLNNIRIVSGQSTDQMAKFAKEANKSAKALSTTTTEYTNASLIYYQQGLSEQEVKERTDITIKMANAAGVSAEHVSDQLTAVWNNFAKGGENLEYYADVMTALGAATASSTDEIAAGLEKFAAIAETVGLSYEYSTAALATITANTRQSADVVGNALKTLFARIQGLSLGETLEDGVDLNKYSSALAAVGVQVLDANGQLRDMDDILDDLAAKWDTIGKAEQTALAQTVAGVRQYTQLVALMENWDDMERNLDVAYNSTGTLQAQADIYAESWEAASDRVRAAAEGIFDSLINDEFFIDLLNGFEKVLTGVEGLIDGFGGLKGVASITGAILLKQFSKELPTTFRNIKENFMVISGQSDKLMDQMQKKSIERIRVQSAGATDPVFKAQLAQQERMTLMQNKLLLKSREMSVEEQQQYQAKIERYKMASDAAIDLAKQEEEAEAKVQKARKETKKQSQESKDIQRAFDIETEIAKKEAKIDALLSKDGNLLESERKVLDKEEEELASLQAERQAIHDKYQNRDFADVGTKGLAEQEFEEGTLQKFEKQVRAKANFDFSKEGLDSYKNLFDRINPEDTESFEKYKKDLELYANAELERLQLSSGAYEEIFDEETGQRKIQKKKDTKGKDIKVSDKNLKKSIASMEALRDAAHDTSTTAQQLGKSFANAAKDIEKGFEDASTKVEELGKKVDEATEPGTAENLEGVITTAQNVSNRQAFQEAQSRQMADEEPESAPATGVEVAGDFSAYAMSTIAAIESTQAFVSAVAEGGSAVEVLGGAVATGASLFQVYTTATQLAKVATDLFANSTSKLAKFLTSAPQLMILAAAIGIIAVVWDQVAQAQERAQERISNAIAEAEEETAKLESLESELQSIEEEIANIKALGSLDIVEESELNKLERRKTLLEAQAAAQKAIADAKFYDQGATIAKDWDTVHKGLQEPEYTAKERGIYGTVTSSALDENGQQRGVRSTSLTTEEYFEAIKENFLDDNGEVIAGKEAEYKKHMTLYEASIEEDRKKKLAENADEVNAVLSDFAAMLESFMADGELSEHERRALRNAQPEVEEAQKLTYGEEGYQEKVVGKFIADNENNITRENLTEAQKNRDYSQLFNQDDLVAAGIESSEINSLFQTMKNMGMNDQQMVDMTADDWSILFANFDTIKEKLETTAMSADEFINYLREDVDRRTVEEKRAGANSVGDSEAQALGLDLESFQAYRSLLYEQNTELAKTPELLNEVAIAHSRIYQGQEKLNKISNDYGSILKKAAKQIKGKGMSVLDEKTLKQLETSIPDIKDGISDLYDVSGDTVKTLTNKDIIENWETLEKAIDGDKDAYNEFQKVLIKNNIKDAMGLESIEDIPDSISTMIDDIANIEGVNVGDKIGLDTDIGQKINTVASEAANAVYAATGDVAQATAAYNAALSAMGMVETGKLVAETYTVTQETPPGFTPTENGSYTDAQGNTYTGVKFIPGAPNVIQHQMTRLVPEGGEGFTVKETDLGGPSGGGGGGGGGGAKAPEKPKDYNKERYYTLTNQLEDIQKEYDEISAAAERAFGKDKLDLIDQQIAKTEEQIEKQKELVAAVEANIPGDQKNLIDSYNKLFNGAGPQFQFDERGIISNFDEIQDYIWEQYQIAEAEDNKELKADLDAWMALYEETRDKLNDEQAKLKELERQQLDLALQKIEYEIELRVELAEDELDFLDYQLSKIEDDAFKAAEAIANLNKQMSELGDTSDANLAGITKILQNKGLSDEEINAFLSGDTSVLEGKGLEEAEVEALRGYRDGLIDTNEQFQELRENVEEQLSEVFDAWQEKLQEGVDKVQHFGSVLESYGNIIDIVGEKTLGITDDFLKDLSDKVVDNAIDNLKTVKNQYEATQETLAEAQAHLDDAIAQGDEDMIKYWTEQVRTISQEADSLSEEVLGAWEEALNKVVEVFEAAVETAVEKFNDAIYELGGLEGLSADFEKQQELADMYLEDYQKIYELSKLNRDITKSMDDMDSISGKRKLRDLQKEINDLQTSGVELSEYDLEYLQKKYDLRMAEIALEEAQNAKDTVRLQKDNEGNYSYVYTANTDAVDEAQQKYEDALYSMQDLSSNYIDEMSSMIIDASQQMSEELAAIRRQDYETEEEYQEALRRVEDYWMERIGRQKNELDKAVNNNKTLYDEDWTNYHNATGYKISDTDKFVTDFSDSMLSALMGVESSGALMNIISNATAGLIEDLLEASKEFGRRTEEIMNEAGTSVKDFAGDVDEASKNIADASKKAADSVGQMGDDMIEDFNNVADSIHDFQIRYIEEIQPIIDANERVVQSLNDIIESAAGLDGLSIGMKDGRYVIEIPSGEQGETSNPPASASMDTGGYTGDWSDNKGRLAWVHKRELMLNQEDTLNVLKAVELTKMMLQTIELNAQQAASGFGMLNATGLPQEEVQTLQQEVHITAEFPNVQDSNEIKDAFNTLINTASQYANRK